MTVLSRSAPSSRRAIVLAAVCAASLVLPLDFSGAAAATPAIGRDFGEAGPALSWVVNAFMLGFGSTLLTAGSLADAYGRRRIFAVGLTAFVGVSVALCLSPTLVVLDVLRFIQGLAAAGTLAGGSAALGQEFEGHARTRAFSLLGTTFGAGLALGPTIAGLLIALAGWRSVFLAGAVVGALALAFGVRHMRETRDPAAAGIDWPGAASFTAALSAFTAAVLTAPESGWGAPVVLGWFAVAALASIAFVRIERVTPCPMLDLSLFRYPRFLGVQALPVATCLGYVVLLVLLPTRFIGIEGRGVIESGWIMLALSAPLLIVPVAAAHASRAVSAGRLSAMGLLIAAAGLVWLARIPVGAPDLLLIAPLVTIGFGAAVPWGLMDGLSLSVVPAARAGMATGIFSTVRVAGEGVAIAVARAALAVLAARHLPMLGSGAAAEGAKLAAGDLSGAAALDVPASRLLDVYGVAFSHLLDGLAGLVALSAVIVFVLLRDRVP